MTTRVDLEGIALSDNSQTRQTLYDFTCMENPNTKANEHSTDTESRWVAARREWDRGWAKGERGTHFRESNKQVTRG